MAPCEQRDAASYWEGNVHGRVADHREAAGWTVLAARETASRQHGVDLSLSRGEQRLGIEVKGDPSPFDERGPMQGQPTPTRRATQARHWFAHILLTAVSSRRTTQGEVVLALPDVETDRQRVRNTRVALEQLGISRYLVADHGAVSQVLDNGQE